MGSVNGNLVENGMRIQGNNPVIDELVRGNNEVVFNIISLIRGQDGARLYSDGRSYLTAQTNADCPMWLFVNANANEQTESELFAILSEAIKENAHLSVNAQEGFAERTLSLFSKQHVLKLSKRKPLNAYFIREVREIAPVGKLVIANEGYLQKIAILVQQSVIDDCDGDMTDEEAIQFARAHANTGKLYLWVQGDVVSMARIVRHEAHYARLTSIVTERSARGNGYAKMLVGELSKRLLAEGITPILYARSENPSSNRCYQKLGFEKAGEICEFKIEL